MSNKVQQIFKQFGNSYKGKNKMSQEQKQAFNAIVNCKTKRMGGHIYKCNKCGEKVYSYNSCNNRHCPNCQDFKKETWIINHKQDILDVAYYHIVFTIPGELHKVFYHNKRVCYNLILKVAKEVIIELMSTKKIIPGIIAMLHTWNQVGGYHPHVHLIVTAGGITKDYKWQELNEVLSIRKMEELFCNKMLKELKKAKLYFYKDIEYLNNISNFNEYLNTLKNKKWESYCKRPFNTIESVYKYLAKYVYKVWIANEKVEKINKKTVIFKYKDSYNREIGKKMKITGEEFIRRLLLHILPKNFMKIRYYGIYAGKNKTKRLIKIKRITKTKENKKELLSKLELLNKINGFDVSRCPKCMGKLKLVKEIKKEKPPDKKGNAYDIVYA